MEYSKIVKILIQQKNVVFFTIYTSGNSNTFSVTAWISTENWTKKSFKLIFVSRNMINYLISIKKIQKYECIFKFAVTKIGYIFLKFIVNFGKFDQVFKNDKTCNSVNKPMSFSLHSKIPILFPLYFEFWRENELCNLTKKSFQ